MTTTHDRPTPGLPMNDQKRLYGRYHEHTDRVHSLVIEQFGNDPLLVNPVAACGLWPKGEWARISSTLRPSDRMCPDCERAEMAQRIAGARAAAEQTLREGGFDEMQIAMLMAGK